MMFSQLRSWFNARLFKKDVEAPFLSTLYPHLFKVLEDAAGNQYDGIPSHVFGARKNLDHRMYLSALRHLGIYGARESTGHGHPAVVACSKNMFCMLDAAWAHQLQHPQHWYMRVQRYDPSFSKLANADNPYCVHLGFCTIFLTGNYAHDIVFTMADASDPCFDSKWISLWLRDYATIPANAAFCRAIDMLSNPALLQQCRATLPNVVLLAWLDHALSLSSELDISTINEKYRYYAVGQQIHPYMRQVSWDLSYMNLDANYNRLVAHVQRMHTENESFSDKNMLHL